MSPYVLWFKFYGKSDAILGNGYEIHGQNNIASLQGSEKSVGLHSRNLILGVQCFRLIMLNLMSVVKWLAPNHVVQDPFLEGENASLDLTPDVTQKKKRGKAGSRFSYVASSMDRVSLDLLRAVKNRESALEVQPGDVWNSQSQANLR